MQAFGKGDNAGERHRAADSGKLYRVLQNILDNALRYSLVGTRIYLEVSRGDIATRLTLTNTASYEMNFAPDDVLQRFVRGDASRTTEGSGLGLSIAQSFMQNFGGGLEVGVQGDTFTVTLTFPGSAAAGNGAAPAVRMEVFGTAETCGENDGGDTEHAAEPMHCPARPQTYPVRMRTRPAGRAQRRKHRNRAASPRHPGHRACAKNTRRHVRRSGKRTPPAADGTDGCSPYGEARPFPIKRPQPRFSVETAAQAEPKSRRLRKRAAF
ncbi:MAG: ATP-binding protein [Ruthenibacterium lactatiformans]